MSGLREKQHEERDARILSSAMSLFNDGGYDAATMDRIAERAAVSVGTLYNYYANKGDILGALVTREVRDVVALGEAVVSNPPADVADALATLMEVYSLHALSDLTRDMWRRAIGLSITHPSSDFARNYAAQDQSIRRQITALIARLKEAGRIAPGTDPAVIGAIAFDMMDRRFIRYITETAEPAEALSRDLRKAAALIAQAIAR